jgi:hypothetical protein
MPKCKNARDLPADDSDSPSWRRLRFWSRALARSCRSRLRATRDVARLAARREARVSPRPTPRVVSAGGERINGFTSDSGWLFALGRTGTVRAVDISSDAVVATIDAPGAFAGTGIGSWKGDVLRGVCYLGKACFGELLGRDGSRRNVFDLVPYSPDPDNWLLMDDANYYFRAADVLSIEIVARAGGAIKTVFVNEALSASQNDSALFLTRRESLGRLSKADHSLLSVTMLPRGTAADNKVVYVADYTRALQIFSATDLSKIASIPLPGEIAVSVALSADCVFIGTAYFGPGPQSGRILKYPRLR